MDEGTVVIKARRYTMLYILYPGEIDPQVLVIGDISMNKIEIIP